MVQKKIRFEKYLFYNSEYKLTASNSMLTKRLKEHNFCPCVLQQSLLK